MQQASVQKFGRVLLIGLGALLALWLVLFFMMMFFSHGRGGTPLVHDRMMWNEEDGEGWGGMSSGMVASPYDMGQPDASGMLGDMSVQKSVPMSDEPRQAVQSESAPDGVAIGEKVRKYGSLDIRVRSADETLERIRGIVSERGGSVTESSFFRDTEDTKSGSVTVKVPVAEFETAFEALKRVAVLVVSENISGSDATEQYADLEARLRNKRVQEAALQSLLGRAEKVSDIIEITRELGNVRTDIESLEGQLRFLEGQTEMSSIMLFIIEDVRVTGDQAFRPGQTFVDSIQALLRGLAQFLNGLISLVIVGIPILLVYGFILWGVFLGVRKVVRKFWM